MNKVLMTICSHLAQYWVWVFRHFTFFKYRREDLKVPCYTKCYNLKVLKLSSACLVSTRVVTAETLFKHFFFCPWTWIPPLNPICCVSTEIKRNIFLQQTLSFKVSVRKMLMLNYGSGLKIAHTWKRFLKYLNIQLTGDCWCSPFFFLSPSSSC